jgi:hypothetical protein
MFFFDSTGLVSLIGLMIQCGFAWIFAAFMWVLAPSVGPWLATWSRAFLGLGLGLFALVMRFGFAHHAIAGNWVQNEGSLPVRLS